MLGRGRSLIIALAIFITSTLVGLPQSGRSLGGKVVDVQGRVLPGVELVLTGGKQVFRLPYLARHQFYSAIGVEKGNWRTRLETVFASRMRTVTGQGPFVDRQATDSVLTLGLSAEYDLKALQGEWSRASLFVTLRNLTDEHDLVARQPAGARSGLPRTLMGGIRFRLGR